MSEICSTKVLPPRKIHLWYAWLHLANWTNLLGALSPDERVRARRLHFESDARRFTVSHYVLRRILGLYLGGDFTAIRFRPTGRSRPELVVGGSDRQPIHFNMSHSGEMVVVGVAGKPLGVDVEDINRRLDAGSIARQYFSIAENAELERLAPALRRDAFFAAWIRKEAYLKALGTGLNASLRGFETELDPRRPARILSIDGDHAASDKWSVLDVQIDRDHRAAVVAAGTPWNIDIRHFDPR